MIFFDLDNILKLAVMIPRGNPLAFSAYSAFVLFPWLILKLSPPGCHGNYSSMAFAVRCERLLNGRVAELIDEAHEYQVTRVVRRLHDLT